MKVTIIYDNKAFRSDLVKDWGFSCLIEAYGKIILFDTGGNGAILLRNMKKLKIDPLLINNIFISHFHFDHIGGLSAFLNVNDNVTVHVPSSLKGIRKAKQVIYYDKPKEIGKYFHTTGELNNVEQSLAIRSEKGLILMVGCSHPGIKNIFKNLKGFGKFYGIIGGFHDFDQFQLFNELKLICPCHCTKYMNKIKSLFPETYIEGGAGEIIEI